MKSKIQKRIGRYLGIILLGGLIWYLFIKPNDYQVTFKAKAIPGNLNQAIKLWANSLEKSKLINQINLSNFTHEIQFNDSIYTYEWNIKPLNDSLSQVTVYIKDEKHSLLNKIAIPFSETDFEKRTKSTLKNCLDIITEHIDEFKVTIIGLEEIPSKYYAYVPLKSKQSQKALKMMQNYSFLNSVLAQNKIKLDGNPFIEIENWDISNDSITFNFCYPIKKTDSLPEIKDLKYKELKGQKAIKAIYNGNYITSDRAWHQLLNYANKNDIAVKASPIEIFYNNPNMGGDALQWKAEIYMPLKL